MCWTAPEPCKRMGSLSVLVVDIETGQPRLVLANRGTRPQKEARQQNEGCQVIPKEDLSQPKTDQQLTSGQPT